jgi:hypothetical protein
MECFTALNLFVCLSGNPLNYSIHIASTVDGRVELYYNSDRNVHFHMNSRKYSREHRQQCAVQRRLFSGAQ